MKLNQRLKDILDVRNNIFAVLLIFMLAIGLLIGVTTYTVIQIKEDVIVISDTVEILNQLKQQPQPSQQQANEFSLLSEDAQKYYDRLGEQVKGTPTWIINDKKYIGFDVKNNVIPGFTGEFSDDTILFASPTCSYCVKAEEYLNMINVDYIKVCVPIHSGDFDKCDVSFIK